MLKCSEEGKKREGWLLGLVPQVSTWGWLDGHRDVECSDWDWGGRAMWAGEYEA